RDVSRKYHGAGVFQIGKDFNIKVIEKESPLEDKSKSLETLSSEVGEEQAVFQKTIQEFREFSEESAEEDLVDFTSLSNTELVEKLLAYLNKIGVSTTSIESYVKKYELKNGVHPSAEALA